VSSAASEEELIVQYLDGAWAEILGWGCVLAGLAALAGTAVLLERRLSLFRARAAGMPLRLERGREWDLVMRRATRELARGPRVEALQADATVRIEAAEYAYNRLLMDCARHCAPPAAPADEPVPEPVEPAREPEKAPAEERAPLAA
jgi:hypothetical protein